MIWRDLVPGDMLLSPKFLGAGMETRFIVQIYHGHLEKVEGIFFQFTTYPDHVLSNFSIDGDVTVATCGWRYLLRDGVVLSVR